MNTVRKKILLVEDETIIAMDEARQLKKAGYDVVIARSGPEAVDAVKTASPPVDLILMDINLGSSLDGTETAQIILKDNDIPVVFLSSHIEKEIAAKTEKITSYGYVVKNSGITVLDASIKMAFKLHAAHQIIRHTNESLMLALSAGRAGIWDWDIVNNTFSWSPEFLELFDLPSETIPGFEAWTQAILPADREIAERNIRESIEKHTELINDYRIVLKSGEIRWIRAKGKTYYANDRPFRMLGLCMDITDRKQAENQILKTLESIQDGFFACDKDWRFIYLNIAAEQILGIPRSNLIGKNFWDVFPLALGTKLEHEYRMAAAGVVRNFENFYEPWGRWFHNRCFPREDGGVSVYFQDITERKTAENRMIRQTSVVSGINKVLESSFIAETKEELARLCLKALQQITESRSGFIAELNGENLSLAAVIGSSGNLKTAIEKTDIETFKVYGIYESVIRNKKGLFHGNLFPDEKLTISKDSQYINSILTLPLIYDNKVTGLISLSGKPGGYEDYDLQSVEALVPSIAEAFQRKRLEGDLKISEEKMRNLIKFAPAGIYEIDLKDSRFKTINDVMCQYLGYSREELLSMNPADLLDDEGKKIFRNRIARVRAGENINSSVEYRIRGKNGREYYAVLNVTFTYKNGKPESAFVIAHDITERKKAELALQQREERYRELVQKTTAVILRIDSEGIIRFANERALEFFGYSENELIGRHAVGTIVPENESTGRNLAQMVENVLRNPDQFHSNINENMKKNGERIWMEWTNSGIYDNEGNFTEFLSVGIDITEQMKAESALEESRKKFQALIETTNDFIWETDSEGKYTYCSPQIEKLWGFKPEAMIGKTPFEIIHTDDIKEASDYFEKLMISPSSFSGFEIRFCNSRGHTVFVETSGVPFFDEDGKLLGFRGISRDITERKKAEEQIEQSSMKINEILNSIQDDFYVLDRNWNFVFASRQFTSRIGKEPKDFVGKNIWETFPKHKGTALEENFRLGMAKREIRRFEIGGTYTNAHYRVTVFPSPDGIIVLGTDITEQKKIENALQESEERFRALFEYSTVGKILISIGGKIIETNQAFAGMVGYSIEEMKKMTSLEILHPDDISKIQQAFKKVFAHELISTRLEIRYIHKSGCTTWADVGLALMHDVNGSPLYFIASAADISERKKAEEALQKALSEKEMLMRELQHRVKNSLSTAVSLIGLEQDNLTDEHVRSVFSNTEARLRTMAVLYDELNQADNLDKIDMRDYLKSVVDMLTKSYITASSRVNIKTSIANILLEPKRAMPLGLIVNELVINALKYAFPSGRKGTIWIKLHEKDENAVLIVTDNGLGLSTPIKSDKSTQFGLKLVEILTDQLKGKVNIENREGVAVTVVFEI